MREREPEVLFYSYSSRDETFRRQLETHLAVLRREGIIADWSFRKIDPGRDWELEIGEKLESATIILLLISANFLDSEYCFGVELKRALQRHVEGTATVIPVILRDCDWQAQSFAKLQALPTSGKPVATFRHRDTAWADVVRGVRRVAEYRQSLRLQRTSPPRADSSTEAEIFARHQKRLKEQQASHVPADMPPEVLANRHGKILAIEDDPDVLDLYRTYLSKHGFHMLLAANAHDGMELFQHNGDVRLVILDLNLPGMSGEEWLAWYLQRQSATPVVVASGRHDCLTVTKGHNNLASLTKPFHMEELLELIDVLIADDPEAQTASETVLH